MKIARQHFIEINSTNTWGKQHSHEFPRDHITLVTADQQTAGRGRFKRSWESPAGLNIYASFCFFLPQDRRDIGNIPQVLALSTADVLKTLGFAPELKWPNDILLSKKKVGGILAETTSFPDALCMVLGIGLNINMPLEALESIDKPATSLMVEGRHLFDVEELLQKLQHHFVSNLKTFMTQGFAPFLSAYRHSIPIDGHLISFHDNQTVWKGTLHHIDDAGALVLKLPDDTLRTFIAGEIL